MADKYITRKGVEYKLVETCGACPEQYDVYLHDEQVGYLRLRHGFFYADAPECGGETIYSTDECKGDGIFDHDERDKYLKKAIKHIHKWTKKNNPYLIAATVST